MEKNFLEGRKKALELGARIHNEMLKSARAAKRDEIERLTEKGYTKKEAEEQLALEARDLREEQGYGISHRAYSINQRSADKRRKPILGALYVA